MRLCALPPTITSPDGSYRWLDVADQPYGESYRRASSYEQATVEADVRVASRTLAGSLRAAGLKPNFAYQIKLVGAPDTSANELLGRVGRWWQEEWSGAGWQSVFNLNDKGDGRSPNPNDRQYRAMREAPDPGSPTGRRHRFTGYLAFAYFITDEAGGARVDFETKSSYHVVWRSDQQERSEADGPLITSSFQAGPLSHEAYGVPFPPAQVGLFGEWERLPVGGVRLIAGRYDCLLALTEESFHGSGGDYAGAWAAALGAPVRFTVP